LLSHFLSISILKVGMQSDLRIDEKGVMADDWTGSDVGREEEGSVCDRMKTCCIE
jgi:hypothetical protein